MNQSFNFNNATYAYIQFDAKWAIENEWDYVRFMASTDGGATWAPLCGQYTTTGGANQDLDNPIYDGFQTTWVLEEIDLTDYIDMPNVRFKMELNATSTYFENGKDELFKRNVSLWNLDGRIELFVPADDGRPQFRGSDQSFHRVALFVLQSGGRASRRDAAIGALKPVSLDEAPVDDIFGSMAGDTNLQAICDEAYRLRDQQFREEFPDDSSTD